MEMVEISKRQLESYKRAEKVCRALRFYFADARNERNGNYKVLQDIFFQWFRKCKKIKFDIPEEFKEVSNE